MRPERTHLRVKIGNHTVDVPIYKDTESTKKLAFEIGEKLGEIEASSQRIDTQAFAIRTAYAYAAELEEAREAAKVDDRELVKALDAIMTRLRKLLDGIDSEPVKADPQT